MPVEDSFSPQSKFQNVYYHPHLMGKVLWLPNPKGYGLLF